MSPLPQAETRTPDKIEDRRDIAMTKKKPKPAPISPEQAAAILQVEQEQRMKEFETAYQALCKKFLCEIVARAGITEDGRIGTTLIVRVSERDKHGEAT